jgi:hypothetical protein
MRGRQFSFLLFWAFVFCLLMGCDYSKKAIELVQNNKDAGQSSTNSEIVQNYIEEGAKKNIQYKWVAAKNEQYNTWIVSFVDTIYERGYFWEADLQSNMVKSISNNWLLKKKYGITPLRDDQKFTLENIESEEVVIVKKTYLNDGIAYKIKGKIRNNTDKTITQSSVGAILVVIYTEQKIFELGQNYNSSFSSPSTKDPWKPNETRDFDIITNTIDEIYKDYTPEDAFCFLYISAEDPLGYEYSGAFIERNLKKYFSELK